MGKKPSDYNLNGFFGPKSEILKLTNLSSKWTPTGKHCHGLCERIGQVIVVVFWVQIIKISIMTISV